MNRKDWAMVDLIVPMGLVIFGLFFCLFAYSQISPKSDASTVLFIGLFGLFAVLIAGFFIKAARNFA